MRKIYLNKNFLFLTAVSIGFSACKTTQSTTENNSKMVQEETKPGINLSFMDKSVQPGDDFFRYVNGKWVDQTEIPHDRTSWGSFNELRKNTDSDALEILQEAAVNADYGSDTDQGKAVNLYKTIMDTVTRDQQGISSLKPYLTKIDDVKNSKDLNALLTEMEPQGGLGFFGVYVSADRKDSNKNVVYLMPGSLGLPDKDYYVSKDADSKEKRIRYVDHITRMLQYLGETPIQAKTHAEAILVLETAMSEPRFTRVERRDSRKTYNPMTIAQLQKLTPAIQWDSYFKGIGIQKPDMVIVSQPKYMIVLQTILEKNNVEDWKSYMRWTLLKDTAPFLSTEIEAANWDFYSKTLKGALKQMPKEEEALQIINSKVGEALGKLYVEKKFPPEAKEKAKKMIKNVFVAFEARINELPWMTEGTKEKAIEKLHKAKIKIGYPDKWKDYSALMIKGPEENGTCFENLVNISKWDFKENINKLGKPVDKEEWFMAPQVVNAYFNPSYNEIVFPAAILQPPFYDYKADEAINYGGIGAVIGHEISHGFDDSGARYDSDGNLVDWWSENDLEQFTKLGNSLADQYSKLEPLPGIFVDGKFTLGENIGDLGGVNAAFDGLQLFLKENGDPGLIDGYTANQRFFISWGTIWRTKMRDEAIKNQVKTDPHSPGMYRAYVPLQNIDAFYSAFDIQQGDNIYIKPENRVKIW